MEKILDIKDFLRKSCTELISGAIFWSYIVVVILVITCMLLGEQLLHIFLYILRLLGKVISQIFVTIITPIIFLCKGAIVIFVVLLLMMNFVLAPVAKIVYIPILMMADMLGPVIKKYKIFKL